MLRVRALITSMYQFGVELRLKSPISVCLTGECTPGVRNCRRAAAIGANYVRSRTKRISCCNDIVRDSFFSSRVAVQNNNSQVVTKEFIFPALSKGFPLLPNIREDPLLVRDDM